MTELTCFKAYDIRGELGTELNIDIAKRIGQAFAVQLAPKTVVIGGDIRLSTPELKFALAEGLMSQGVNVIDIGLCGTEEIYFATTYLNVDGGIMITASHNPKNYNGLKLVKAGSQPISGDSGLFDIKTLAEQNQFTDVANPGSLIEKNIRQAYTDKLLSFIDISLLKPMTIVVNAGNGAAGHAIDEIEQRFIQAAVPVKFIKVHHQPDGHFPNGIPNPLLPENRSHTADAVVEHNADLGIAWDGDFDRCFLFDQKGNFIEGYYIVGLLAEAFLQKHHGEKIIHDPRLTWNTIDVCQRNSGIAVQCKTGHAFIKERMRLENAIYGGEMSAHHYFRDFYYCDSGMIPWLLVIELLSHKSVSLSSLLTEYDAKFPASGEINRTVNDARQVIDKIKATYSDSTLDIDTTDGLSMEFDDWRFNLRMSNTEPLLRLNVEAKSNRVLMKNKTNELLSLIEQFS
ncbi:phosphomannomutase CpsG [Neptunicella sp.]|uniref:phosphomannomutase CpsG n=1 Tax=Neptunicella sp. TaxID=2125986 RepID=UPI003F691B34